MQIKAGSNRNPPNIHHNEDIKMAKAIALKAGMTTSILFQVPNQPIHFYDDWWIEIGQPRGLVSD